LKSEEKSLVNSLPTNFLSKYQNPIYKEVGQ